MGQSNCVLLKEVAAFQKCPLNRHFTVDCMLLDAMYIRIMRTYIRT